MFTITDKGSAKHDINITEPTETVLSQSASNVYQDVQTMGRSNTVNKSQQFTPMDFNRMQVSR